MKKQTISYLYLAISILLWASIPVASKKILMELNNFQMLFYSTILSVLLLTVILFAQKKTARLRSYSLKDYGIMIFLGFLGTYLYYVLLYGAFSLTTAAEGFILAYTWPLLVLVLAFVILREKVTARKIIAILMGFLGIILIVTHGKPWTFSITNVKGDALALFGALVFALFSILGKKFRYDQTISVFVYFLSAMVFITVTVLLFYPIPMPSLKVWPWLIYNGFFVNGISYIFWFKTLEHGETHIISSALYLTPFLSLLYIFIFLDEKILLSSFAGLIIIVSGITIQLKERKTVKRG